MAYTVNNLYTMLRTTVDLVKSISILNALSEPILCSLRPI